MSGVLSKILLVEDEEDIQDIATMSLETLGGFEVKIASSGKEALSLAPEFQPDLILLDVMMPEMDGPTTLESLRSRSETASIPVVFMTAKVQTHEIDELRTLGVLEVIQKPFSAAGLPRELQAIWENR